MAIVIEGDYYNVIRLPDSNEDLEKDVAYIVGNYVLPFYGEVKYPKDMKNVGLYILDGKLVGCRPTENNTDYSTDNIIVLDISKVLDKVQAEGFLSPEDIERINMASDFKGFEIYPNDDFLTVIVKTVINMKKVNPKVYASRLPKAHKMSNMIKSLIGGTDMSMKYFSTWKELLEIDFDMVFYDSDDSTLPIDSDILINSIENKAIVRKKDK